MSGPGIHIQDTALANRIHNKGSFGTPQSGNTLQLTPTEAAYLVHAGRLEPEASWTGLLDDEVAYLAYADLRDRGLVVRHDGDAFLVWRRGEGPKDAAWFRFHARSERDPLRLDGLEPGVIGVVDEDGVVTHYEITSVQPEGKVMPIDLPSAAATVLHDRIVVQGQPFAPEHFGTPHGDKTLLSFTEAEALRRRGVLDAPDDLADQAAARQFWFAQTLPVFLDLRRRGVVARSGFRFGTHLRAYEDAPDACHARWLVQCPGGEEMHWSDLSRAVRLAHGVRKDLLLAGGDPVEYLQVTWFRP